MSDDFGVCLHLGTIYLNKRYLVYIPSSKISRISLLLLCLSIKVIMVGVRKLLYTFYPCTWVYKMTQFTGHSIKKYDIAWKNNVVNFFSPQAQCETCLEYGHVSSVHDVTDFRQRRAIVDTVGWQPFQPWFYENSFRSWWQLNGLGKENLLLSIWHFII